MSSTRTRRACQPISLGVKLTGSWQGKIHHVRCEKRRSYPRAGAPCDHARTSAQRGAPSRGVSMVRAGGRVRVARANGHSARCGQVGHSLEPRSGKPETTWGVRASMDYPVTSEPGIGRPAPSVYLELTPAARERQEETARVQVDGRRRTVRCAAGRPRSSLRSLTKRSNQYLRRCETMTPFRR